MNPAVSNLRVSGFVRMSTCDWPGELAATVFCQGCVWDCPYCHNPGLRAAKGAEPVDWPSIRAFLKTRVGLLDAVVFSGGEPTLQAALPAAMEEVKRMGFRIGLHTAGAEPSRIAPLIPWLDWVGFDVKAPFADYARITGVEGSGKKAHSSLSLLLTSGVACEVRTTVHPELLNENDLATIKNELLALGVTHYVVQQFRAEGVRADRVQNVASSAPPALPQDYGQGFSSFQMR